MSKIKLGDITKIRTGKLDANASSEHGKYPFFTCSKDPLRIDSYSYDCECVLVAGNGDLNVKYYKGKFDAYQRTYIIEDNSSGRLYMPYLYYYLDLYVEELRKQSIGGVIKYIKLGNLTDAVINLPPIETQKETIKILDKSRKLIENKNMQLQEYDLLIKSRFVELFESFDKTNLSNVAEIIMGQSPDSSYYNENGIGLPFFQGKADFGAKYTKVSYWTRKPSKTAKKGNVLMSVRAPVGPVNISSVDCCIGRGLCSINAIQDKTNNEFLYNALIAIQDQITAMGSGSTFKAINKNDVYTIQLPLAPISLQNEFASFVEQVDKLKFAVQQSLNATQSLFDSLMQEYFG
jgi:type I restriction enzyme, S subunit